MARRVRRWTEYRLGGLRDSYNVRSVRYLTLDSRLNPWLGATLGPAQAGFCPRGLSPAFMNRLRTIAKGVVADTARRMPERPAVASSCAVSLRCRRNPDWLACSKRILHSGCVAAILIVCVRAGIALEPSTPLANFGRQAWVMENGLPQNTVQALVQTKDGFVWLGTEAGLVRFDGIGFQVFDRNSTPALPGNDVCCLLEGGDGGLWVGTSEGLARLKDGEVRAYSTRDGLPGNGIRALAEGSGGALWVSTDQGWARLSGDKFVAAVDGHPGAAITSVSTKGSESISSGRSARDGEL